MGGGGSILSRVNVEPTSVPFISSRLRRLLRHMKNTTALRPKAIATCALLANDCVHVDMGGGRDRGDMVVVVKQKTEVTH